jgi:hypothetical protein
LGLAIVFIGRKTIKSRQYKNEVEVLREVVTALRDSGGLGFHTLFVD